jgi:hypothetical protein
LGFLPVSGGRGLNYCDRAESPSRTGPVNRYFLTRPIQTRRGAPSPPRRQRRRHATPVSVPIRLQNLPLNPTAPVFPHAAAVAFSFASVLASSSPSSGASPPPPPWGDVRPLEPFPPLSLLVRVASRRFDPFDEWLRPCGRVSSPCLGLACTVDARRGPMACDLVRVLLFAYR